METKEKMQIILGIVAISIAIASMFIALISVTIAWNVAHGDANLELKYVLGDKGIYYTYITNNQSNQDLAVQFIVRNRGYGSTVYDVDSVTCMNPPNCLPDDFGLPQIRYNDEKMYRKVSGPDFRSIGPKSSDLVEIIFENITPEDMPKYFEVRVQDYISGKEMWSTFYKSPMSMDFLYGNRSL